MAKDLLAGTKNACQCSSCDLVFTSSSAFDKHRTGTHPKRRCMSKQEMNDRGLEQKLNGRWGAKFTGTTTKHDAMKAAKNG